MTLILNAGDLALLNAGKPVTLMPPPPAPPPIDQLPDAGAIYKDGKFFWPGDWSSNMRLNYADTEGLPGGKCIRADVIGTWGLWLPYAPGQILDLAPFGNGHLAVSLKPVIPNQRWSVRAYRSGDVQIGQVNDITAYGPAPIAGQWGAYMVPLSALNAVGVKLLKINIQDQTGLAVNHWYIDKCGFVN